MSMHPFIFHCPVTGRQVQGTIEDGLIGPNTILIPVDCPLCNRPHLIDPSAGKVPRKKSDKSAA
jgi:hypothetical protein